MTVIVERDTSLVEMFQSVLGSCTVVESVDQLKGYLDEVTQEYAVVLGPSVNAESAAEFAEQFRVVRPALSVILVRGRVDTSVLANALRSGLREVVESRDLTGLGEAVRRAYDLSQAIAGNAGADEEGPSGRLVTVFSTKGGVGKSTVATNLGSALADLGQRVCLVDLDVQSGDVAIMLQLFPSRTLTDLARMSGSIDPGGLETLLTEHSDRLSVLAAPMYIDREPISPDLVGNVLKVAKTMFDMVVVDTSGSFDDYALQAFDHSDLLVLVGTLDIPALKSLKLATDTLDLLNMPRAQWRLVLNRADAKVGLSPKEFEETLGLEITAAMESSRDVLASVNRGEAIVRANPRHPVSQSIQALAKSLSAAPSTPPHDTQSQTRSHALEPRRSLLRKKVRQP